MKRALYDLERSVKKRGQTQCYGCGQSYNNNSKPAYCSSCHVFIGGKEPKSDLHQGKYISK